MFGARVLGKEEAARAAKIISDGAGGGAIQFGSRVLGKEAAGETPAPPAPPVKPVKPATTANRPLSGAAKAAADRKAAAKSVENTQPQFSEEDVAVALAGDPTTWKAILRAEGVRPEGVRPAVARLLLDARAQLPVDDVMPAAIVEQLEALIA